MAPAAAAGRRVDVLGRQVQRCAARDQDLQRSDRQELCDQTGRPQQVFKVVEHQEQRSVRNVVGQPLPGGPTRHVSQVEGADDGARHELGIRDRIEAHEPDAVAEGRRCIASALRGERGLTRAARPHEGDQARSATRS